MTVASPRGANPEDETVIEIRRVYRRARWRWRMKPLWEWRVLVKPPGEMRPGGVALVACEGHEDSRWNAVGMAQRAVRGLRRPFFDQGQWHLPADDPNETPLPPRVVPIEKEPIP